MANGKEQPPQPPTPNAIPDRAVEAALDAWRAVAVAGESDFAVMSRIIAAADRARGTIDEYKLARRVLTRLGISTEMSPYRVEWVAQEIRAEIVMPAPSAWGDTLARTATDDAAVSPADSPFPTREAPDAAVLAEGADQDDGRRFCDYGGCLTRDQCWRLRACGKNEACLWYQQIRQKNAPTSDEASWPPPDCLALTLSNTTSPCAAGCVNVRCRHARRGGEAARISDLEERVIRLAERVEAQGLDAVDVSNELIGQRERVSALEGRPVWTADLVKVTLTSIASMMRMVNGGHHNAGDIERALKAAFPERPDA